jgi:hypothetical protein
VPLSADGTTSLSLSGELRVTYERFGNQNFGLTPPDPDGYFLQRYLLHTDVHAALACASGPNLIRASRTAASVGRDR